MREGANADTPVDLGSHGAVHLDTPPAKPATEPANQAGQTPNNAASTTPSGAEAPANVPAMPEGGADKFYNADTGAYNWEAHARELEFKAAQAADKARTAAPAGDDTTVADAAKAAADAGFDVAALEQQILDGGDLTDDQYKALEAKGFRREFVEGIVNMSRSAAEARVSEIVNAFGGEETFDQVKAWMVQNLTADEIQGYEELINGPKWRVAVQALQAQLGMAQPAAPQTPTVTAPNASIDTSSGVTGFKSDAEFMQAMQDPRYKTDAAYREQFMARAQASGPGLGASTFAHGRHTAGL